MDNYAMMTSNQPFSEIDIDIFFLCRNNFDNFTPVTIPWFYLQGDNRKWKNTLGPVKLLNKIENQDFPGPTGNLTLLQQVIF